MVMAMMLTSMIVPQMTVPTKAEVLYDNSYLTHEIDSTNDLAQSVKTCNHVTWDEEENCAVFDGQASYIEIQNPLIGADANTGFIIKMEAYIDSQNNAAGTYTTRDGRYKRKNGYQRLFDLSDGTDKNWIIINAGSADHVMFGVNNNNNKIHVTQKNNYYDGWHTYELVVSPGGYTTLYVDDNPVSYCVANNNYIDVLNKISTLNTCYLGTSIYEFTTNCTDGFFFGKMRNVSFTTGTDKGAYDGKDYYYTVTYNTNGGDIIPTQTTQTLPNEFPIPVREGIKFEGWYTDPELTMPAVEGSDLEKNITLYAKWEGNEYVITSKDLSEIAIDSGVTTTIDHIQVTPSSGCDIVNMDSGAVFFGDEYNLSLEPGKIITDITILMDDSGNANEVVDCSGDGWSTSNDDGVAKWTGNAKSVNFGAYGSYIREIRVRYKYVASEMLK